MKSLVELLPVLLFFVSFKFYDIYTATLVAIVAAIAMTTLIWLKYRRIDMKTLVPLSVLVFFGGATLLLKDPIFIKWKPTVVTWLTGLVFLGSHFIGKKPLVQRIFGKNLELSESLANKLNIVWVCYFFMIGGLNLFVLYNFDTNTWVNFKLFGVAGMTFVFAIIQSIFIVKKQHQVQ
jgi:intracellular septation protein